MIPAYVTPEYLSNLTLRKGCGSGKPGDCCAIQEVRRWLDLDPSTDACPPTVDPLIHRLVIRVQDERADWRQEIVPLLTQLPGSRGDEELLMRRAYRCVDWAIRESLPVTLDYWDETKALAKQLAALGAIRDRKSARAALDALAALAARAALAALAARHPSPVALIAELLAMKDG